MRGRKKVRLNPLVREILSFPNESGLASLTALLDYIYPQFGDQSPSQFVERTEKALRTCWRFGYLYLELRIGDRRRFVTVSEWEHLLLKDLVGWDEVESRWRVRPQLRAGDVLIQITQAAVRDLALYREQIAASR